MVSGGGAPQARRAACACGATIAKTCNPVFLSPPHPKPPPCLILFSLPPLPPPSAWRLPLALPTSTSGKAERRPPPRSESFPEINPGKVWEEGAVRPARPRSRPELLPTPGPQPGPAAPRARAPRPARPGRAPVRPRAPPGHPHFSKKFLPALSAPRGRRRRPLAAPPC